MAIVNLPEIRIERCVRYRFRYSECERCVEGCPPKALRGSEEGVALDSDLCSGCGLCAAVCPTAVFHLPRLPLAELAKPRGRSLAVACIPSGQKGDVRVPCLGDLDLVLLASLAQRGIVLTLRGAGYCEGCAHGSGGAGRIAALLDALDELGSAAAASDLPWSAPTAEAGEAGERHRADRRQLFRRWANRAEASARQEKADIVAPASAIRAAAHFVPARRRLTDTVLSRFDSLREIPSLGLLFGTGVIEGESGRCTGCEACFRVCPTGALKVAATESQWQLNHQPGHCVGCGVCVEACGPEALRLHHRWRPGEEQPLVLHALRHYRCQGCGRFFIGLKDDVCPVCRDDENSFTAIFG